MSASVVKNRSLIEEIDSWLPQTQCTQCGYPRCRDYAEAIAGGEAEINQCPPGNPHTIKGLAALLECDSIPLNTDFGTHSAPTLATIIEHLCIGCTLCIQACPVDAIIGCSKQMHSIISAECTGCELCIPACPVDCIELKPANPLTPSTKWRWPEYDPRRIEIARRRTETRIYRLQQLARDLSARKKHRRFKAASDAQIRDDITAAVERKRKLRTPASRE